MATTNQFSKLTETDAHQADLMPRQEAKGFVIAAAIATLLWGAIAAGSAFFFV